MKKEEEIRDKWIEIVGEENYNKMKDHIDEYGYFNEKFKNE